MPYRSLVQVAQNIDIDYTLLFSVSNTSKNNLDFTIKYLETNFNDTTHYIISNNVSLDTASIKTDVKIFSDLDNFLEDISQV